MPFSRFNRSMKDYYKILELHPEASPEVMTKAYRALAGQFHPDRFHVSDKSRMEERMREINEAYSVLSDPEKRRAYDRRYQDHQATSPERESRERKIQKAQSIAYWALLTILLLVFFRIFAGFLLVSPLGKTLLLVGLGYLALRYLRKRG